MSDQFDDDLRDALRAEANGVNAGPELLDRIVLRNARRAPSRWRRAAPWLAVAAAAALVAAVATTLPDERREELDVAGDTGTTAPSSPSTSGLAGDLPNSTTLPCSVRPDTDVAVYLQPTASDREVAAIGARIEADADFSEVTYMDQEEAYAHFRELFADQPELIATVTADILPPAYFVNLVNIADAPSLRAELAETPGVYQVLEVDCGSFAPIAAGPPATAVAVTRDGRLVVIDVPTGEEVRELAAWDDPTAATTEVVEGGLSTITGVALHPNGRDVYVETCCEPASGHVFRVAIDGTSQPEAVTGAYGIDISADGHWLIGVSGSAGLLLYDLENQSGSLLDAGQAVDWQRVGINPNGSEVAIALVQRDDQGDVASREIQRYALTAGRLGAPLGKDATEGMAPLYTRMGRPGLSYLGDGLDLNVEASGMWLLEVDADGRLVQHQEGAEPSVISEGPFVAADW